MATLDATTLAEYVAEVNAVDRAQVVVDALADPVSAIVYTSEDVAVASGTMVTPWATVSGYAVSVSTLDGFFVTGAGTPNDGWYLRFSSGSRYVDLSFGLLGSGKEAVWSLPTWDVGTRAGIISGTIAVTGNQTPVWSGASTTLFFNQGTGGTYNFGSYASDPDGEPLTYSLVGTAYTGISINASTGVLTVSASAVAAVRNLTVRATDPDGLYADWAVAVTISSPSSATTIKWNPGFYIYLSPSNGHLDGATQRAADLAWFQNYASDSTIKGFYLQKYLRAFETGTTADYSAGFDMLDYYLSLCTTYNKRLCVEFENVSFGASNNALPTYWQAQGWQHEYVVGTTTIRRANTGISACRDRLIALIQAYAQRYNSHPRLEVVGLEETTTTVPSGITSTTWIDNYKAILTAAAQSWTQTLFRNCENGQTGDQSLTRSVYEHVATLNSAGIGCIICGGPDHEDGLTNPFDPTNEKSWKQLWRGQTTSSGVTWLDARRVYPFYGETQERGFYPTGDTPANVCSYQIDFMRASHVTFLNYTRWSEVYAAIAARSGATDTVTPSCLAGRTVTGGT